MLNILKTTTAIALEASTGIDFTPSRSNDSDAGYDVRACIPKELVIVENSINRSAVHKVGTGIRIDLGSLPGLPEGQRYAIKILNRSGTKGLRLFNQVGLLDEGYIGELFVRIYNGSDSSIILIPGERFAQFTIEVVLVPELNVVKEFTNDTDRGDKGFGSIIDRSRGYSKEHI